MHRVRVVWAGPATVGGGLTTLYFASPATTATQAVTAAATFLGAIDARMKNTVSWATEADVYEIDEVTGAVTGLNTTTPQTGTGGLTDDLLPPEVQGLLRLRTNTIAGTSFVQGRLFIPGLTVASNNNGVVNPTTLSTLNAAAAALIADSTTLWGVWSRTHGTFAPVDTATLWTQFAALRSRRD